ncbi:adenosylcobinamide-GDP ribazoletransferase [Aestuariivirga litoralis]|uniref:adenosylcobinamide-GDP ribazoletransferase n=1 Tax=Aestuariivirga litoralis TaxID=2650924 RepID=UPI0018C84F21|nr:adenosylcobinamide-GDP ribazoletransferase [Aestuariivirga litoralis]MBG1232289.1 adenosylcobinamide-GDP ribazoletransferase [Aestuariivirga litoralis]
MSDISDPPQTPSKPLRPVSELLVALQFLTRLPIPFVRTVDPVPLAQSMRLFALAGALIGAVNGVVLTALSYLQLPDVMAAALAIGFGLFLTGAIHEDGLADTADGLLGGKTRERRLEIMRDSRIGTYGASALILAILCKASAYHTLGEVKPWQAILMLAATGAFSRAMVVDMMWATRSARSDGLASMAGRPSRAAALFSIVTGGALTVWAGWFINPISGVEAMAVALLITALMRRAATRLVGGQTGDICGAVQVLTEIGMLATFFASIH